jgi:hypothetical protein
MENSIDLSKTLSIYEIIRGTLSFIYYASPVGYAFDYARHERLLELWSRV